MTKVIFNTYDENGYRRNINGNRSSQTEDNAIEYKMRFEYRELLAELSDAEVVNAYDLFSVDSDADGNDYFGNNDDRFEEWMRDVYSNIDWTQY